MYAVGAVKKAVDDGCENINAVIIDGAQIFIPPMENTMANLGKTFGDVIILPPTAQDYSAEVAQATSGADCVIGIISRDAVHHLEHGVDPESGTEARQYGPQGNLNEVSAAGNEEATDGDIIVGMYPDISTDPWSEYRVTLDEAGLDTTRPGLQLARRDGHLGCLCRVHPDRRDDRGRHHGSVVLRGGYNATSNLDLNGMVPVLDFTT